MSAICLPELGAMPMPPAFRYRDVLTRGRNAHPLSDGFFAKHPPMPVSRWAKIFAPFDALSGFDEAISSKEVAYTARRTPDADAAAELNRRLAILSRLAASGRLARRSRALVEVTAFVPCADPNHAAFGRGGRYECFAGPLLPLAPEISRSLTRCTDGKPVTIFFDDILRIESDSGIFDSDWQEQSLRPVSL